MIEPMAKPMVEPMAKPKVEPMAKPMIEPMHAVFTSEQSKQVRDDIK